VGTHEGELFKGRCQTRGIHRESVPASTDSGGQPAVERSEPFGAEIMSREGRMKCPRCQVDLSISDRQGVEIDFCPQCRGVWLDRGELDKIIERASRFMDEDEERWRGAAQRPDYDRDYYYRKRKSFWRELFD
jgi:Zn-finger nucleic acid-binding protein